MSYIADREDGRHARLEGERLASQLRSLAASCVAARKHESIFVRRNRCREPLRLRAGADHHEEGVGGDGLFVAGFPFPQHELLQPSVTAAAYDFGPSADFDVWGRLDGLDEILRHARVEEPCADDERYAAGVPRKVKRGLAGRVSATGDEHFLSEERRRLRRCRAVKDAG